MVPDIVKLSGQLLNLEEVASTKLPSLHFLLTAGAFCSSTTGSCFGATGAGTGEGEGEGEGDGEGVGAGEGVGFSAVSLLTTTS